MQAKRLHANKHIKGKKTKKTSSCGYYRCTKINLGIIVDDLTEFFIIFFNLSLRDTEHDWRYEVRRAAWLVTLPCFCRGVNKSDE